MAGFDVTYYILPGLFWNNRKLLEITDGQQALLLTCELVGMMVSMVDMMVMVSLGSKPPGDIRGDGP